MASQGLIKPLGGVTEVIHRLVGLQAQDEWVAGYTIRPRATEQVTAAEVTKAEGLICTWAMRGTLHLMTAPDARWIVELLGPRFLAKTRGRRHQLGVTDEMLRQALPVIRDTMPAKRAEIAAAVRKRGLDLAEGQAEAYLIAAAALSGLIHRTAVGYDLLPTGAAAPDDPPAELARRYAKGYGPAQPEDFAAWSGLPLTEARKVFHEAAQGKPAHPPVRLLGHFDPFLLGYRDRSFTLDPAHAKRIQRGGGFLQPIVVVDGRVVGTWSREWKAGSLTVAVESFGAPIKGLDAEINDLNRFYA